jgi:hypothetical protein
MTNNDVVFYFSFSVNDRHQDRFQRMLDQIDRSGSGGFPVGTTPPLVGGGNIYPPASKIDPMNFIIRFTKKEPTTINTSINLRTKILENIA